ncbi:S8 family serine peptidase [Streptomyces sp. NPDC097619]|uniref:S8 family peptidase n=1 Tax=Streptomyces sp. NPDC097619 TaxID=3157228 RepID=UPI00331D35D6
MLFDKPAGRGSAALLLVAALATGGALAAPVATAAGGEGTVLNAGAADAVPGSYIVMLKGASAKAAPQRGAALAARYQGKLGHTYSAALQGYSMKLSEHQARRLAADPSVQAVIQDTRVHATDTTQTNPPSWGLDRIDRRRLPLDKKYVYPTSAGSGVTAYIIDTGIRITHKDFGGRARYGFDAIDGGAADDPNGHGTHVAGTVMGSTFGVAKKAKAVSVRVLDANGSGSYAQVIAGVDWVTRNAVKPAVANMSLGGSANVALDTAVRNSVRAGITYAVAAGNSNQDASGHSPAREASAITVGATEDDESRADYSNFGKGVDLFAPGSDIVSASNLSDTGSSTKSGTSMASPHVAGWVALYLGLNRTATPAQVDKAIKAKATTGTLHDLAGSPNRLLYVGGAAHPAGPRFVNTTNYTINDNTRTSSIKVTGVAGKAPKDLDVEVNVKHGWRGDLRVDLIAPDGSVYRLKTEYLWDSRDNVIGIWGINASSETAKGTWKLRVADKSAGFGGYIDGWALRF